MLPLQVGEGIQTVRKLSFLRGEASLKARHVKIIKRQFEMHPYQEITSPPTGGS
ncbi:hypothetical protein [Fulvivirga sp.]|uniref:hypothetical protein n=1 Tax=Fulvivirga sp. TaxID=1931237 RepID=UPI0032EAE286